VRRLFCVVGFAVAVLFGSSLGASDSAADTQALSNALTNSNLFISAAQPFSLTADITLYRMQKGDEKGTYKVVWLSNSDWRRDLKTPMFDSSEGVMQGTGWEKNNLGWLPLRAMQLEDVREAYAQILEMSKNGQASQKRSKQNTCWKLEEKDQLPMEVCVSNETSTVESMIFKNVYYTFKDYKEVLGKKIPQSITANSNGQNVAALTKIQVTPLGKEEAKIDPPPAGAWQAPDVVCNLPSGVIVHKVAPEYPAIARQNNQVGAVTIGAMVDAEGKVRATAVLQSAGATLDRAADEAVKTWRYEPFTCNGKPVERRTQVTIQFNPGHADMSKGLVPLYR
jgi:TonB family protein